MYTAHESLQLSVNGLRYHHRIEGVPAFTRPERPFYFSPNRTCAVPFTPDFAL
jgi:hypothetical protein